MNSGSIKWRNEKTNQLKDSAVRNPFERQIIRVIF